VRVSRRVAVPLFRAFESSKADRLSHSATRDKAASLLPVPGPPSDRKLAARLALASVLGCVATALCYFVLVHTSPGQRLDDAAYYGAVHAGSQHFGFMDTQLERIDERSLKLVMVAIFAIGVLRGRPILGVGGALVAGGPVAAAHILRYHVLDHSPFVVGSAIGNTFPSDHAAAAVGCAMALVLVSPPWLRGLAAILGGAFAAAVAAQVQVIGWHRASDSIGACLLAFVFASAVAGVLAWTRPGRARKQRRHWWALAVMAAVSLVAITLGAVSAAQGIATSGGVASPTAQHHAYLAGLDVTIGIVALLLAVLVLLLGDADFDDGWRRTIVAALDLLQPRPAQAPPDPSEHAPRQREDPSRSHPPTHGDGGTDP
jgi:membrane-associated phospholipid phosphatase